MYRTVPFQNRTLPDPDGSETADALIAEYFKKSSSYTVPLKGFDDKLKCRQELLALINKMEKEKKQIEQELKLYMGEAETAENSSFRVSWKPVDSIRIDSGRLKEENSQAYARCQKHVQCRKLTVNAA